MTAYWREWMPRLDVPEPEDVTVPSRPFAKWEREVFRRLAARCDPSAS